MSDDLVTPDSLNEYMRTNRDLKLVRRIECRDGFTISVQGHYGAYSAPREDGADYYSQVECGYPSGPVPEIRFRKEGDRETEVGDTETIYGYVPIDDVVKLLNAHGGIKGPRHE